MQELCADIAAEQADLDGILSQLDEESWDIPTPAPDWTVRDQVGHLLFVDRKAYGTATDPEAFLAEKKALAEAIAKGASKEDIEKTANGGQALARGMSVPELLTAWREENAKMREVFSRLPPKTRLPWYGPPMSARSFATARLMELWAHGIDILDTLEISLPPTNRLRHIAHIGVTTRDWSYAVRGMTPPPALILVELTGPTGDHWSWTAGKHSAATAPENTPETTPKNRVYGPALDFCLVTTQRRHPNDTEIKAEGPLAQEWLQIAQAFAGPPGPGREAGQFSH